jgi:hypothetical protein
MTLKNTIENHALEFANGILRALRTASLDELCGLNGRGILHAELGAGPMGSVPTPGARLGRRSAAQITRVLDQIVGLLEQHPDGLRAEVIKRQLGIDPREVPRPLADGVSSGRITKVGEKRATTYFATAGTTRLAKNKARRASGPRRSS